MTYSVGLKNSSEAYGTVIGTARITKKDKLLIEEMRRVLGISQTNKNKYKFHSE